MRVIVPLAGPDLIGSDGSIKSLTPYKGGYQLKVLLDSRPWAAEVSSEDYNFVLFDHAEARAFARGHLSSWFPGCRTIFISHFTRGAALSMLAGVCFAQTDREPLIVDLADIDYKTNLSITARLAARPDAAAIALTFPSDKPIYSYLEKDASGAVIAAAEKTVISNEASAGTYIFASATALLRAVAHALENEASQTYNMLFYVCPLFNGILDQGHAVLTHAVTDVVDFKTS